MLKEIGGLAGVALMFSPVGMPFLLHGFAGIVVGGAGLVFADAVLKQMLENIPKQVSQTQSAQPGKQNPE